MRENGRGNQDLRKIEIKPDYITNQPVSVYYQQGNTKIMCTALLEGKVPRFLKESHPGQGWVTAEYAMLPGSTGNNRVSRERNRVNNRNIEIQRFISRALRCTIDLMTIDGKMIQIDTDVIQADGSTRCASVNAGMLALVKMLRHMVFETEIKDMPKVEWIAAVSVGIKGKEVLVDLDYQEDVSIDADINVISTENKHLVEVSAFAEGCTVSQSHFAEAVDLAIEKNCEIIEHLKKYMGGRV